MTDPEIIEIAEKLYNEHRKEVSKEGSRFLSKGTELTEWKYLYNWEKELWYEHAESLSDSVIEGDK